MSEAKTLAEHHFCWILLIKAIAEPAQISRWAWGGIQLHFTLGGVTQNLPPCLALPQGIAVDEATPYGIGESPVRDAAVKASAADLSRSRGLHVPSKEGTCWCTTVFSAETVMYILQNKFQSAVNIGLYLGKEKGLTNVCLSNFPSIVPQGGLKAWDEEQEATKKLAELSAIT